MFKTKILSNTHITNVFGTRVTYKSPKIGFIDK